MLHSKPTGLRCTFQLLSIDLVRSICDVEQQNRFSFFFLTKAHEGVYAGQTRPGLTM